MSQHSPVIFADALLSVRLASGVIRITFGSLGDENKLEPTGTLVVPHDQFNGIGHHLAKAAEEVNTKAREAQAKAGDKPKKQINGIGRHLAKAAEEVNAKTRVAQAKAGDKPKKRKRVS